MTHRAKTLPWVIAAAFAGSLMLFAFWPSAVIVETVTVDLGRLEVTVREEGRTRIRERYVVSTPLTGELLRVNLHPGDNVTAGETLIAAINPGLPELLDARAGAETEARVQAAESRLQHQKALQNKSGVRYDHAKSEHSRAEALLAKNAIAEELFESAVTELRIAAAESEATEFEVRIAEFELQQAQAALLQITNPAGSAGDRLEIRSPISGEVLRVFVENAGVQPTGTAIVELGDRSDMEVEIDVLSSDAVRMAPGARVYLEQSGLPETLEGRLRLIEPQGFEKVSALGVEEQRVNVIVDFTSAPAAYRQLGDAYRVEARIVLWAADSVLKVSSGALFRNGEDWAVYRIRNGRARLTIVQTGHTSGRETEIVSGLEPGDVLIAYPGDQMTDGAAVQIR